MTAVAVPLIAVGVVLGTAGPAAADDKVARVGIVVSVTVNVDAPVADSIGASLATALVKKLKVDAIGGAEATRRMPTGGLPDECVSTPACITDIGRRLGADQLLFLGVVRVGADYQVDATFIDVATGKQAARPRVQVTDPARAGDQFVAEAERYLPDAELRTSTNQTVVVHTDGERHRPIKTTVWILAGVSVAAIGAGIGFGLSAKSKFDGCNSRDMAPFCTDSDKSTIETRALISDISLGVALGAAVGALVIYFKTPVEVTPTDGGAVLSLDGRF